jgi:AraC-like DNA-binding protein
MPSGQNEGKIITLRLDNMACSGESVAASLVEGVINAAESAGIALQPSLILLGLDVKNLANATQRVELTTFRKLLRIIAELSEDETIGLRIGHHLSISSFNALGHAAASSEFLLDALRLIPQFEPIIMTVGKTEILQEKDYVSVCWSMKSGDCIEMLEEIFLSCWINLAKLLTGYSSLDVEVGFTHSKAMDTSLWNNLLGCTVFFDQSIASIKFDKSLLTVAIEKPDPFLREVMTKEAEGLNLALSDSLTSKIELWLDLQLEKGEPEQGVLAKHLNMSERTLRRYLKNENTNFKSLLRKVKMSKANELLHKTSLSLWEISSLLGYQQLTSFNAAYKRWTGRTPASQRKKMLSKN